jgi:hypothetical protein
VYTLSHCFLFPPVDLFLSALSGEEEEDDTDEDEDVDMVQAPSAGATAVAKGGLKKKPPPTKPDPTAAITNGMAKASLQSSPRFNVTMSPTTFFRDGKRRVCVFFFGITMHFDNYKVEVSGRTLKLYMRVPSRFFDPKRVDAELASIGAAAGSDRDTIVSAQTETANLVYQQYGSDAQIWTSPQVVILPMEVENVHYFKPIFSDGCDELYNKLTGDSVANGGTFPNNAVHQMFTYLRVVVVSNDMANRGSNKKLEEQVNLSPTRG